MRTRQEDAVDCKRLFVYGTLRRGFRLHHHLARLGAQFESEAKVVGELFDLGSYPGAKPAPSDGKWIFGEIYGLRKVSATLAELDDVEQFLPGAPERSLFVRSQVQALLLDGIIQTTWIYWLAAEDTQNLPRIESGDYATLLMEKGA